MSRATFLINNVTFSLCTVYLSIESNILDGQVFVTARYYKSMKKMMNWETHSLEG